MFPSPTADSLISTNSASLPVDVRRPRQAVRHFGPQQPARSFPAGRRYLDDGREAATGHALAAGRDHARRCCDDSTRSCGSRIPKCCATLGLKDAAVGFASSGVSTVLRSTNSADTWESWTSNSTAAQRDRKQRSSAPYQRKLLELGKRLRLFMMLPPRSTTARRFGYRQQRTCDRRPDAGDRAGKKPLAKTILRWRFRPASDEDDWQPVLLGWTAAFAEADVLGKKPNPATLALETVFPAYRKHDAAAFNRRWPTTAIARTSIRPRICDSR